MHSCLSLSSICSDKPLCYKATKLYKPFHNGPIDAESAQILDKLTAKPNPK